MDISLAELRTLKGKHYFKNKGHPPQPKANRKKSTQAF